MNDVIICGLATFHAAYLLTQERGPGNVFLFFREKTASLTRVLTCGICAGTWVGGMIYLSYQWQPWIAYLLAICGVNTLIQLVANRLTTYVERR